MPTILCCTLPNSRYRAVAPKDLDKYAYMEGFKLLLSESAEVRQASAVRRACPWHGGLLYAWPGV